VVRNEWWGRRRAVLFTDEIDFHPASFTGEQVEQRHGVNASHAQRADGVLRRAHSSLRASLYAGAAVAVTTTKLSRSRIVLGPQADGTVRRVVSRWSEQEERAHLLVGT
jgi:hypothetical protein